MKGIRSGFGGRVCGDRKPALSRFRQTVGRTQPIAPRPFLASASLALVILTTISAYAQEFENSIGTTTVPFTLFSDFLIVLKGQIGDVEGLKFILDTGATRTAIDQRVAKRLHLRTQTAGTLLNFERHSPIDWTDLPELKLGDLRVSGLRVMVLRLADYSEFGEHVDGIIGLDFLSGSTKFVIDYSQRTVSFELANRKDRGRSLPLYFYVSLSVQGLPLRVIVDTGFQGILLYSNRFQMALPGFQVEGQASKVVMGRLEAMQEKVADVRVGGREVREPLLIMMSPIRNSPSEADGCLGLASLHAKRVVFDFGAHVLSWQ